MSTPAPKPRDMPDAPDTRIRARRLYVGYSVKRLAEKARVSPRTVHNAEYRAAVSFRTQEKMLAALDVPFAERTFYFGQYSGVALLLPAEGQG